jgi:exosortase/archaeosortase family protein
MHRLWFIPMGILAIYAANVFRVVTMLGFQMYWPAAFDPMHSFGMTTFFYVIVFGLWMAWVHLNDGAHSHADNDTSSSPAQTPALSS